MRIKFFLVNASVLALIAMLSCVPAKEFQELQDKNMKCEEERDRLSTENESLTVKNSELESK
ncbi:MAG TPA: hypothetical protein PLA24_00020, partial [Tenuifilaceae bacterium]|nr:hypothetical protein [Tenuifilaceae bacterium]